MNRKDKNNIKGTNAGGSGSPNGAPAFNPNAPTFIPGASTARTDNPWKTAGPPRVAIGASSGDQGTPPSSDRTIADVSSSNQGHTTTPHRPAIGSGRRNPRGIPDSGVSTAGTDRRNQVATPSPSRVARGARGVNLPTSLGSSRAAIGDSPGSHVAKAVSGRAPPNTSRGTEFVVSSSNRPAANVGREYAVASPGSRGNPTNVWGNNRGITPGPSGQVASPAREIPRAVAGSGSQADPVSRVPTLSGWSNPTNSSKVKEIEDAIVEKVSATGQTDTQQPQLIDKTHSLAQRPDYGSAGDPKPVSMWANYFELRTKPGLIYYQYKIIIEPVLADENKDRKVVAPKGKKLKEIIKIMLQLPQFKPFEFDMVTDFAEILISRKQLDVSSMRTKEPFQYQAEDSDHSRGGDWPKRGATRYNVTLDETESPGSLQVSDLIRSLQSTELEQTYGDTASMVQALDIVLGQQRKSAPNLITLGRGRCFPKNPNSKEMTELGDGLIAIRGFFSSVRVATGRILLNCNICHGAFYPAIPLVDLFKRFEISENSESRQKLNFEQLIQGLQIEANHLPRLTTNLTNQHIPRVYRVFGLARPVERQEPPLVRYFGAGPQAVRFHRKNPDELITIDKYWQDQNYRPIADLTLPVVNIGDQNKPRYLPPHVCTIVPGQVSRKQLLGSQTTSMIKFAKRDPGPSREIILRDSFGPLGLKPNRTLDHFGIVVNPEMISVTGRVLQPPTITYLQNTPTGTAENTTRPNNKARWDLRDGKVLYSGKSINSWSILRIARGNSEKTPENTFSKYIDKFLGTLKATIGKDLVEPPKNSWEQLVSGCNDTGLKKLFIKFRENRTSLLIVVLPSKDAALYNRIKKLGDCEYGIQTVCVFWEMFYKGSPQYYANVALKVNLKLGGINHSLKDQLPAVISKGKTMVIGIDVTHPTGAKSTAPSVAAMVASADNELGQWPADLRINTAKKEMVDLLEPMLGTRLDHWAKLHDEVLPENLLIYRDGVSEGQYQTVLIDELKKLRDACKEKYKERYQEGLMPRITLIIVGKRHHTRFYQKIANRPDQSTNPSSGTLVDRGITEARNWDFFLQSHHALQGTARPAHYFVLLNEIFSKANGTVPANGKVADVVETLTFNMCHLFGRATTAVSIPPPVFYADLACERGRRLLGRDGADGRSEGMGTEGGRGRVVEDIEIHEELKDKMFYI